MNDIDSAELQRKLTEQGETLNQIRDALLGSLDGNTVGLIADHRALKQQVSVNTSDLITQRDDISDLKDFKREIKKMVAFVAFSIPFAFEVLKGALVFLWEYLKSPHK